MKLYMISDYIMKPETILSNPRNFENSTEKIIISNYKNILSYVDMNKYINLVRIPEDSKIYKRIDGRWSTDRCAILTSKKIDVNVINNLIEQGCYTTGSYIYNLVNCINKNDEKLLLLDRLTTEEKEEGILWIACMYDNIFIVEYLSYYINNTLANKLFKLALQSNSINTIKFLMKNWNIKYNLIEYPVSEEILEYFITLGFKCNISCLKLAIFKCQELSTIELILNNLNISSFNLSIKNELMEIANKKSKTVMQLIDRFCEDKMRVV